MNKIKRRVVDAIGGGIGPEVSLHSRELTDFLVKTVYGSERSIEWLIDTFDPDSGDGEVEFERLIKLSLEVRDVIKSCFGNAIGTGFRSYTVEMRNRLGVGACVRPIKHLPPLQTPLKNPKNIDMVIFRENFEDIYVGLDYPAGSKEAIKIIKFLRKEIGVPKSKIPFLRETGIGIKPISRPRSRQIMKDALEHAFANKRSSVTIVHKGNIQKNTEGAFRNWCFELAETEYANRIFSTRTQDKIEALLGKKAAKEALRKAEDQGLLIVKEFIADNSLQQLIKSPQKFDVVVTTNLNGDYISDAAAATVGGLGIAYGGNFNFQTGMSMYEATHGTAPDIVGLGIANFLANLLSRMMMLEKWGWNDAVTIMYKAIENTFKKGLMTGDLAMENEALLRVNKRKPLNSAQFKRALKEEIKLLCAK